MESFKNFLGNIDTKTITIIIAILVIALVLTVIMKAIKVAVTIGVLVLVLSFVAPMVKDIQSNYSIKYDDNVITIVNEGEEIEIDNIDNIDKVTLVENDNSGVDIKISYKDNIQEPVTLTVPEFLGTKLQNLLSDEDVAIEESN